MTRLNRQETRSMLLALVEESYEKKSWHGPNLRGSLRGITVAQAIWRPGPNRHNIWEILLHCAYWKYVVRRKLSGEKRGSFPVKGSNWFTRPIERSQEALLRDTALLADTHEMMVQAIADFDPKLLEEIPKNGKVSYGAMVRGIAFHDVYHAGQIQLLKKLEH